MSKGAVEPWEATKWITLHHYQAKIAFKSVVTYDKTI